MNKEEKLNLNAGDYAIRHCIIDQTYNGLEVHKMLCDAFIAGNNDTLDDEDERIRKALIDYFDDANKADENPLQVYGIYTDKAIAWLKKQGDKDKFIEKELGCIKGYRENAIKRLEELEKQDEQEKDVLEDAILDSNEDGLIAETIRYKNEKQGEQKSLNDVAKEVTKNKETAISFLKSCGIMNANGEFADEYKIKQDEQKPAELAKGEDYGIDGLWHAQRILEKTFGKVDGYQTDDGILSHECAISAVKELYKKKPAEWSEEDENRINRLIAYFEAKESFTAEDDIVYANWLKSLRPHKGWLYKQD